MIDQVNVEKKNDKKKKEKNKDIFIEIYSN